MNNSKVNDPANRCLNAAAFDVSHVRWGKDDKYAFFTLELPGLSLYSCKLTYNKAGEPFVVPSQTQGKDGKWYNNFFLRMNPDMEKEVIRMVEENDG